ncbi:uncharacterized protein YgbK (DUF1537 family) [Thermocatellispora tengchongensis]|uniref:Uncharacterized protein YgbK (DUF1537 family) n=1 Tax=Thermocatellispora tengchongensis TaxID=1073253 RepID=A0A840PBH0_9ACTN|nr:four-carbon acid sugar kinase family protein [Thermocatellispora tengchongensis]MBB5135273.1 uncharacterized protein YgbK (DUF1537 family) [Thermocatellispora tengchongensis]
MRLGPRVVVLDDDPTGTQAAAGVTVLLDPLAPPPPGDGPYYVLTNTRAMAEPEAVALLGEIRARHGEAEYVLRGDSTLRGHVFAESDAFGAREGVLLFAPAFPAGGRTTVGGVHYVDVDGRRLVAADTEFAADPVFGYTARTMVEWVREVGGREAVSVPLARLGALADVLGEAAPATVVVPDAESDDDLRTISAGLDLARRGGARVVLRCAAPLAAIRADRLATGLLTGDMSAPGPALIVCGSHTEASGRQLAEVAARTGAPVRTLSAEAAQTGPGAEGERLAALLDRDLDHGGIAILATERVRRAEHGSLQHGARVMRALCGAVAGVAGRLGAVIAKGGITSAQVARDGLGAQSAEVLGPLLPGVAVWRARSGAGTAIPYAVVPGNIGGPRTLVDVAHAFGLV